MRQLLCVVLFLLPGLASAVVETWEFPDQQQRVRYIEFTRELRCPKCQNQNLADSNSPIAADLRRELHRLLIEGRSDEEIVDFMVTRYGEYVLYRPRLEPRTWLLWGAPVLLLVVGGAMVAVLLRRARAERDAGGLPALSEAEKQRLLALTRETQKQ